MEASNLRLLDLFLRDLKSLLDLLSFIGTSSLKALLECGDIWRGKEDEPGGISLVLELLDALL